MNPVTHYLMSWTVANSCEIDRKERTIVTLAGVVPDLDGMGILYDLIHPLDSPLQVWSDYHHTICHNVGFGILLVLAAYALSTRKWMTSFLVLIVFHLHLLCDVIGAKGPDGHHWPIPYLLPFSNAWQWSWQHQWLLNAWPNFVITVGLLIVTFYLAWKKGYSPLEMISLKMDRSFIDALRRRFNIERCKKNVSVARKIHRIIHLLTIVFAWICWGIAIWLKMYWLFILSVVPYLIFNQIRIPSLWKNGFEK